MNVRYAIVMLFLACVTPQLTLAGEGQLVCTAKP
jgi:hypothetical protein